jgi:Protein of unknown function (DUF4238)
MAGIKQHYLPRLLLKGFASRTSGKEIFTWAYRKGQSVFEPNINDFSAERNFYGKQGARNVDDQITTLEGEYAEFIEILRAQEDSTAIHDDRIVQFVTHILVRTKHLRESFSQSSNILMDKISERLSDSENIKRLIFRDPKVAASAIDDLIEAQYIPSDYRDLFLWLLTELAPTVVDEHQSEIKPMVESLIDPLRNAIPKAVKNGHINALTNSLIPEIRVEAYRKLNWFIHVSNNPVILGDIGVLTETGGPKRFKSLSDKDDEIKSIVLPISSSRVVIGTGSDMPVLDFDLNEVIAACSRQFFISSRQSSEMDALHVRIGEQSEIITAEELEEIVDEGFRAGSS